MPTRSKRIAGLDIAKCIAMFCVVLLHFSFSTRAFPNSLSANAITSLTAICVPLFFAVNGALLLRKPLDTKKHIQRLLRVVILALIWRLLTICFVVVVLGNTIPSLRDIVFSLLGGNPDGWSLGHFWFLNALIAIYLFLPALKALYDASNRIPLWFVCGTIFVFTSCLDSVKAILEIVDAADVHNYASLLSALPTLNIFGSYGYVVLYFVGGALIADVFEGKINNKLAEKLTPNMAIFLSFISAIWIVVLQHFQHVYLGVNFSITYGYWLIPTIILTLMVLYLCMHIQTIKYPSLSRLVTALGSSTFGIYMLHFPLIWLFAELQDTYPMLCFVGMGNIEALIANICCAVIIFLAAAVLSVVFNRLPIIKILFNL